MKPIRLFLCMILISFFEFPLLNAQAIDESRPSAIEISKISEHLYVITCYGGEEFGLPRFGTNLVASAGPDGILLVDAAFASTGEKLRDTLKTLGNGKLKMVINTHYHGDHTFGNQYLKNEATIMAHRNAVAVLSGDYYHLPGQPDPNCPMVGFDDSLIIYFNEEEIHVVHTPGCHTGGDVYVHFTESKIVAAGDLFFADEFPYIDLPNNGSVEGYRKQIKGFIEEFPDGTKFIPGHGRYYTKDDLKIYADMLAKTSGLIRQAMAEGKTAEDMISENLLADWQDWNGSFATTTLASWIRTVYFEASAGTGPLQSICEPLTKTLLEGTVTEAIQQYHSLKTTQPDAYDFGEGHLNMLGYQLLTRGRIDDALEIFKLNIEAYPQSSNVYDSYGEALMIMGDTTRAIANYEKSLKLNPENTNAVEMIKRMRNPE
jgi:cyclase